METMMTYSIYGMFETDEKLEREGIILDYGKFGKFRVARAGGANSRYEQILAVKAKPHERRLTGKKPDLELGKTILLEAFVEGAMLGWDGVRDKKGKLIKFSIENCMKLFQDLPQLYADIRSQSDDYTMFLVEELEEDAKN
jgi:hypothetical protein